MANTYIPDLIVRNAVISGKNFSGRERVYNGRVVNPEGKRTFMLQLDPEMAQALQADGWNVKWRPDPNDPNAPGTPAISVDASWGKYPPEVFKKTKNGNPIQLDEEDMAGLDRSQILTAHVTVHPRQYTDAMGRIGVKAWLRRLLVVVEDDPFADYFGAEPDQGDGSAPFDM